MTLMGALDGTGLSPDHLEIFRELVGQLYRKQWRNMLRRRYYDYKQGLRDLGIAIPPQMQTVETVLGWPAKSVDMLARRVVLEGLVLPDGDIDAFGWADIWRENRLDVESDMYNRESMICSTAFISVSRGDVSAGEPEVLILGRSAQDATGLWDPRRRGLSAALSVVSVDKNGVPDYVIMYLPDRVLAMRKYPDRVRWDITESPHNLGRVPVEPLPFMPSLRRPFGRSRISRPVMALTDSAVRTLLRSEVSAEFYSAPQRYVLGANADDFTDADGNPVAAWQAVLGRMLAMGRDEDGNLPTVGQFPQQSMEPHFAQLRGLAMAFAAETNLPVNALGVIHDNPSSAEAMYAANQELIMDAEYTARAWGPAYESVARMALMLRDASPSALAEYRKIRAKWRNPATPSLASAADYTQKLVASGVLYPDSEVTYDGLGFSEAQRETLRSEGRRRRAEAILNGLGGADGGGQSGDVPGSNEPGGEPGEA